MLTTGDPTADGERQRPHRLEHPADPLCAPAVTRLLRAAAIPPLEETTSGRRASRRWARGAVQVVRLGGFAGEQLSSPGLMPGSRPADHVGVGRLEERWRRRQEAYRGTRRPGPPAETRTVRFQEAARLPHPPGAAWALIHPAECAPLLSSTTARGFTVPGTPDGVGEQQCFIDLEGNASVIEIIPVEKGRCATTRVMSPTPPVPTRTTFEVQPIETGCIVILTIEVDLPVGRGLRPDGETEWRHWAADYLERLRRVLGDEAGGRFRACQ